MRARVVNGNAIFNGKGANFFHNFHHEFRLQKTFLYIEDFEVKSGRIKAKHVFALQAHSE